MNRRRTLLALLTAIVAGGAMAMPLDPVAARATAQRFVAACHPDRLSATSDAVHLVYAEPSQAVSGAADYYVFNSDAGFVIIAGDDRAATVLAYGDQAVDMTAVIPCNAKWMLDQYKQQMEWLHAHPAARVQAPVSEEDVIVAPLVSCAWDQRSPYRNHCPYYNGIQCVTGCVATALAQVMYSWQFPQELPPLPAYTTKTKKISVEALPGMTLRWDLMLDRYQSGAYDESQGDAVAWLMRYCGQACQMDYDIGGSSAWSFIQLEAAKLFGYNSRATQLMRANHTDEEWNALMLENLCAGRPLLYSGSGPQESHAFVIDGYKDGKYHVNWGWGGYLDGYFLLDAFTAGGLNLFYRHSMQHQLYPDGVDSLPPVYDFDYNGLYYKRLGDCSRLTYGPSYYDGDIVIPSMALVGCIGFPVIEVGAAAFMDCTDVTSVTIGDAVTTISEEAFARCTGLKTLNIPASLTLVNADAFLDGGPTDTVNIESLESWCRIRFLGENSMPMRNARHLCLNGDPITHLVFPRGLTKVNPYLFTNCEDLQSVVIPNSVDTIGKYAFCKCSALTDVTLGDSVTWLGYSAFSQCAYLTDIRLPESLKGIDRFVFNKCVRLTSITVPDRVDSICGNAFYGCRRLAKVTLGRGLKSVGYAAFGGCQVIDTLTCRAIVPPALNARTVFHSSVYNNAILRVPRQSLAAYRSDAIWSNFQHIEGCDMGYGDVNGDGDVNIADINFLIDVILQAESAATVYDVNGDGEINIADINSLIDYIIGD